MSPKNQKASEALNTLPDDATIADAIEKLCFIAKVEKGLAQAETGEIVPHEDIKDKFHR